MSSDISEKVADSEKWEVLIPESSENCRKKYGVWRPYPTKGEYCRDTKKRCLKHNCPHRAQQTL